MRTYKLKEVRKVTSDDIFKLGILLLPFENLFFAPSLGWAAISPIIFFIYCIFNLSKVFSSIKKYYKIFIVIFISIIVSFFLVIISSDVYLKNLIGALISIVLGLSNLLSFDIYFRQKKKPIKSVIKILVIAYSISLIYGWIQYICLKLNLQAIIEIIVMLSKRGYYLNLGRVQFTFTEPSFLSVHLYGVLLPFYIFSKDKKIIKLILAFLFSALLFNSSLRLILDTLIVLFILIMITANFHTKKNLVFFLLTPSILFTSFMWAYHNIPRFKVTLDQGIYADGSFASRYFRINASIKGYQKDPLKFITGYGMGNSLIPLRKGYIEARNEYKNTYYLSEVNTLGNMNYQDDSVSFCLYIRIISEFGFIILVLFLLYLFQIRKYNQRKENLVFLLVTLYLYVQFESYAFYSIWLYIVFCYTSKAVKEGKRNEQVENSST